jgi:cystathionine gamma-synthase
MQQINTTAVRIATFLESHPAVEGVIYPGLPSHPQYDLARRQMDMPGGVIAFRTAAPQDMARQLAARLRIAHYAFSLGHQRSMVTLLETEEMVRGTYRLEGAGLEDYCRFAGDGLFRLSVGLEAAEDLVADLDQALGA